MEQPLISVIVPVYNVACYLQRCLDSICKQTYPSLEILLIDDGSTDQSGDMCDAAASGDSRIRVVHKRNGGLSDARNVGICKATGDYLTFVDSDDSIALDMIEYLYSLTRKYRTDMALCSHTIFFDNGKEINCGNGKEECLSAEECIGYMLYHRNVDTSAWAKLYKREVFSDISYPVGKLFEDIGTTYKTFIKCGRIACGYISKYNYYVRKSSIVRESFSMRKLDLLEMTDAMGDEVETRFPMLRKAVLRRRLYARFSSLNQMEGVAGYDEEKEKILKFISAHAREVFFDSKAPLRDKAAIMCILFGEKFYFLMWHLIQ